RRHDRRHGAAEPARQPVRARVRPGGGAVPAAPSRRRRDPLRDGALHPPAAAHLPGGRARAMAGGGARAGAGDRSRAAGVRRAPRQRGPGPGRRAHAKRWSPGGRVTAAPHRTRALLVAALVLLAACDRLADRQAERAITRARTDLLTAPELRVVLCGTGSPL